ncbi:helix-turn-helix domain-containing protein [Sarcina ventriculi]|uniref:helix-turn-helix domain-containing protein n=1 Tax=Sarcina ventriculi TaxID=1267 RepID=UPI000DD4D6A6|nr:helix-turn-helix transcriptional regulator [Sarcina ventriculi]
MFKEVKKMKKSTQEIIASNLKEFRKRHKLTQEQLAKQCNISKNAVWNYENNLTTPSIETLDTIANIFKISIIELLFDYDETVVEEALNINKITQQKTELLMKLNNQMYKLEQLNELSFKNLKQNDKEIEKFLISCLDGLLIVAEQYPNFKKIKAPFRNLNLEKITHEEKITLLDKTLEFLETQLIKINYEKKKDNKE